jgi:predicted nucleic acid-binding protein
LVNEEELIGEIRKATKFVKDEKDTPLVALAMKKMPCTILTKNSKDFHVKKLESIGIKVMTPVQALKELFGIDIIKGETRAKRFGAAVALKTMILFRFRKLFKPKSD